MARTRFITPEYLYKYTIIDDNVDADILLPYIDKSQRKVESIIGNALYTRLKNDIDSTGTTTGDYLTLLTGYIQQAQADWVLYKILPFINFKVTNKAVSKKSSDNSEPSDKEDITWLQKQAKDDAEDSFDAVIRYLKGNAQLFPEYYQTIAFNLIPKNDAYFGGIYLGKSNGNNNGDDCDLRNARI